MSRGRWARLIALVLLVLTCQGLSLYWQQSMAAGHGVTLYLPAAGVSYRVLKRAEERTIQPTAFAAWNQLDGQTIENAELERAGAGSIVTVYGDSTLVLPELTMLLPGGTGCLLDKATSYRLFGDESPIGGTVRAGEKNYTIAGIFEYPTGMLVRQGSTEGDSDWNRLTLALPQNADATGLAQEFALRHGLAPYAVLSSSVWNGLAAVFSQLVPILLFLTLLLVGLRTAFVHRQTPVMEGLVLLGTVLAAVVLWFALGLTVTIPTSLIPARWSDFEFWAAAATEMKTQLWLLLTLPKELPQALPMGAALHCVLWGGLAALCYLPCAKSLWNAWRAKWG